MNKFLAVALVFGLSAVGFMGANSALAQGVEGKYELVDPPQPTETPGKVEVLDIFWFGCPHCYSFLPEIERYENGKPEYVEMRRMPAIFRESWEPHARAYYVGKVLGIEHTVHRPIFETIHEKKARLSTRSELKQFFGSHGVSEADFDNAYDSFAVESLVRKSLVMQQRFGITGTPTVIVNGKYRVSGSLAGSYQEMVRVIATLVEREKASIASN